MPAIIVGLVAIVFSLFFMVMALIDLLAAKREKRSVAKSAIEDGIIMIGMGCALLCGLVVFLEGAV